MMNTPNESMDQWVKVSATKPDNLCLLPRTHIVEEENQLPQVVLWPTHVHSGTFECARAHTHTSVEKILGYSGHHSEALIQYSSIKTLNPVTWSDSLQTAWMGLGEHFHQSISAEMLCCGSIQEVTLEGSWVPGSPRKKQNSKMITMEDCSGQRKAEQEQSWQS